MIQKISLPLKRKGFTVAELVVGIGIFVILGALTFQVYMQGVNIWYKLTGESTMRSRARRAMNFMMNELKNATRTSSENPSPNLAIPSHPNNRSIDFYLPVDSNDANTIIINALGAIEWDKSNKIQYQYIPGQQMLRRLEKGNHVVIAEGVSAITFEDASIVPSLLADELRISLTLLGTTERRQSVSSTVVGIVSLRN